MRISSRLLVSLPVSFIAVGFGACNCDPDLYSYPGTLQGLVCNQSDGQAMKDGKLTIKDGSGKKQDITTKDNGTFTLPKIAAGEATITIHDASGDRAVKVFVESGKTSSFADSTCHPAPPPPGGEIDGCVCDDAAGAWVVGANVFVVDPTSGGVFSTGTDSTGCFKLANVSPGAQTVKVQSQSGFYQEFPATVVAGQTVDVGLAPTATCAAPPPPPGSGTVDGRVCASDGQSWLAGATVSVTRPDGSVAQTTTDGNGHYELTGVPAGQQTIDITKGSFSSSIQVNVVADQTTTVPDDQCSITNPTVKIAVVSGQYDNVQQVLTDLGVDPANVTTYNGVSDPFSGTGTTWAADLLDDYATLSQYNIVFFNCGVDDSHIDGKDFFGGSATVDSTAIANLKQFVQNGGSVYASDWAYTIVETAWPDEIDYDGTDNAWVEGSAGSPKTGAPVDGLSGTIVDANLAAGMGSSSISLDYKLSDWVVMQNVASDVTVYIRGDAPLNGGLFGGGGSLSNVPHTVGFTYGAGHVLYTSFHQEPGVNQGQERVLQLLMFTL